MMLYNVCDPVHGSTGMPAQNSSSPKDEEERKGDGIQRNERSAELHEAKPVLSGEEESRNNFSKEKVEQEKELKRQEIVATLPPNQNDADGHNQHKSATERVC
ncbi:hypothetical protein KIN20_034481 [Parelaphostrongylus tenuis]|uniref:Uncharacterized protein n=1 Tax=Parelaphostrongylus tenuis TaxID=148309 RepID=A0AAD5RAA9_PARTN|nr:hypothetical protein KIN20_034481 [Parelaphostrongylus tenuis]